MVDSEGGSVAAQRVPGAAESVVDGIFVRLHRQYAAGRVETYHEANKFGGGQGSSGNPLLRKCEVKSALAMNPHILRS